MSDITGSQVYHTTLVVADDGDPRAGLVTAACLEGLLDNSSYLLLGQDVIHEILDLRVNRPLVSLLGGADHTVSITQGNVFILADMPSADHVITLKQTVPTPPEGSWMRFMLKRGSSPYGYTIKREGSSDDICVMEGYVGIVHNPCFVEVQVNDSGQWVMTACSGPGVVLQADA